MLKNILTKVFSYYRGHLPFALTVFFDLFLLLLKSIRKSKAFVIFRIQSFLKYEIALSSVLSFFYFSIG
jgi:hypothetical protein